MRERRVLRRGAVVIFALLALTIAHAQTLQRGIYASVLDKDGTPVPNMTPADFVVREDNVSREVLRVERATAPMQIALLVDNSTASGRNIRDIRDATTEFIKAVTGNGMKNEVALFAVAERPTILVDYTTDQTKLLKGAAIFSQPGSAAYMLDGIFESSRALKKREATRPVLVGIATNGPDYSARYYHDQVMGAVNDIGASLNIVMVGPPPTDITSNEGRERNMVYSEGTENSGGRYDNVLAASAMPMRLKQVADELTHQYLVTYARPTTLIPPEHIKISSKRSDVTVRGTPVKTAK